MPPPDSEADPDALEVVSLGEGDPYEILEDVQVDDDVIALACSAEIWAFPRDLPEEEMVGSPSERDDRVEMRVITCVDHEGHPFVVSRVRGDEPEVHPDVAGPLFDALSAAWSAAG